jgi:hypothetical protein
MADVASTAHADIATDGRSRAAEVQLAPDGDERYGHLLAHLLRTSQQHLVQMSAMADVKAQLRNICRDRVYLQSQKFRSLRCAYRSVVAALASAGVSQGFVSVFDMTGERGRRMTPGRHAAAS